MGQWVYWLDQTWGNPIQIANQLQSLLTDTISWPMKIKGRVVCREPV